MFLLLENDEYTNRWRQVPDTTVYETLEEAVEEGERLELFDTIVVEHKRFI